MRLWIAMILAAPMTAFCASFGESLVGKNLQIAQCQDVTLMSLPFDVSVSSRIFASAFVSDGYYATIYAKVTNASGSTVLGVSPSFTSGSSSDHTAISGVVHQGTTPIDTAAQALVLQPGSYQLQMYIRVPAPLNCSNFTNISEAVLTYMLLSATYDRVFADGFS